MFGWLKNVVGSTKVISALIATGDALVNTSEEHKSWILDYIKVTGNLARRYIAFVIVFLWAFMILSMFLFNQLLPEWYKESKLIMEDHVDDPFLVVLGFYFLKHTVQAGAKAFASSTK